MEIGRISGGHPSREALRLFWQPPSDYSANTSGSSALCWHPDRLPCAEAKVRQSTDPHFRWSPAYPIAPGKSRVFDLHGADPIASEAQAYFSRFGGSLQAKPLETLLRPNSAPAGPGLPPGEEGLGLQDTREKAKHRVVQTYILFIAGEPSDSARSSSSASLGPYSNLSLCPSATASQSAWSTTGSPLPWPEGLARFSQQESYGGEATEPRLASHAAAFFQTPEEAQLSRAVQHAKPTDDGPNARIGGYSHPRPNFPQGRVMAPCRDPSDPRARFLCTQARQLRRLEALKVHTAAVEALEAGRLARAKRRQGAPDRTASNRHASLEVAPQDAPQGRCLPHRFFKFFSRGSP